MSALPLLIPGVVVSIVVSLAAGRAVARALGTSRIVAVVMVLAVGVILSATLTPLREAIDHEARGPATCDLSRIGLAPFAELLTVNDTSLNVLMFVPLGATIAAISRSRRRTVVLLAAITLPFAIEATQLLVPFLDRACESADVVDNLAGLLLGLAGGSLARVPKRIANRI